MRVLVRPFGYLAFGIALLMLWVTARLLGRDHELGFFSDRLHRLVERYPEVNRWSSQAAWFVWGVLFAIAVSPLDPIASSWDEIVLLVVALIVACHRLGAGR
jgi:hypothetical protein